MNIHVRAEIVEFNVSCNVLSLLSDVDTKTIILKTDKLSNYSGRLLDLYFAFRINREWFQNLITYQGSDSRFKQQ